MKRRRTEEGRERAGERDLQKVSLYTMRLQWIEVD